MAQLLMCCVNPLPLRDHVFLDDFDDLAHGWVTMPYEGPLGDRPWWLISWCHPGGGFAVELDADGTAVRLPCWVCGEPGPPIALEGQVRLTPTCRHRGAKGVAYATGFLLVTCLRCSELQWIFGVAAYVPDGA